MCGLPVCSFQHSSHSLNWLFLTAGVFWLKVKGSGYGALRRISQTGHCICLLPGFPFTGMWVTQELERIWCEESGLQPQGGDFGDYFGPAENSCLHILMCECMYFLRVAGRVCPVVHKVDVVWPWLWLAGCYTGSWILKSPPSPPVGLIWQDTECMCRCMCMCVRVCVYCDFPALFSAYLPCRWSQSPLTRLFLSHWSDLNVWVFLPVLTSLHRASFFYSQKDLLSRLGDSMEIHVSSLALFAKLQIITWSFTWSLLARAA